MEIGEVTELSGADAQFGDAGGQPAGLGGQGVDLV
jgi:hypothetical protein